MCDTTSAMLAALARAGIAVVADTRTDPGRHGHQFIAATRPACNRR
jgi:hypothetical protein